MYPPMGSRRCARRSINAGMTVAAPPQLVEGQRARLDAGVSLPCRVIGFSGPDVVLALDAPAPPDVLAAGGLGYLLVESEDGQLHAVRGRIAAPPGDEVVLRLTDRVRLGQRRLFSRAPIALAATLRDPGTGESWSTVTRDISAGGVCAAHDPGAARDAQLELTLEVGEHTVAAEVRVARAGDGELGLSFHRLERDDRLLLAALALAYHRRG
jgi:PilZ domain